MLVIGAQRRPSQPAVPVKSRRRRAGVAEVKGRTGFEVVHFHKADRAKFAAADIVAGNVVVFGGAVLRADLDDPLIFPGRLDHSDAFPDAMRVRFLDVHILAGLAGQNRQRRMPVVVSRHDHRVHIGRFQHFSVVGLQPRFCRLTVLDEIARLSEPFLAQVAQANTIRSRLFDHHTDDKTPAPAATDQGHLDLFVCATDIERRPCCGQRQRRACGTAEKCSA